MDGTTLIVGFTTPLGVVKERWQNWQDYLTKRGTWDLETGKNVDFGLVSGITRTGAGTLGGSLPPPRGTRERLSFLIENKF